METKAKFLKSQNFKNIEIFIEKNLFKCCASFKNLVCFASALKYLVSFARLRLEEVQRCCIYT